MYNDLPTNISFPLYTDWISKNVTIGYEGVSIKKQRVSNGDFNETTSGWTYKSNTNYYTNASADGAVKITITSGHQFVSGDYGYYEQNITLNDELASGKTAILSMDYLYTGTLPVGGINVYLAVIIDGVEKNITYNRNSMAGGTWLSFNMIYDPKAYGQILPGIITIRVGLYTDSNFLITGQPASILFDNIKFDLWTMPNAKNLVYAYDVEFPANYTYTNTSYGSGYSFVQIDRSSTPTQDVVFTIYHNVTGVLDSTINNITIESNVVKSYNSTIFSLEGSSYSTSLNITWNSEFIVSIPFGYFNSWGLVKKPADWIIQEFTDLYNINHVGSCTGAEFGSENLIIPSNIFGTGLWKLKAISQNYIDKTNFLIWNSSQFTEDTKLTFGDIYLVNVTLNNSLSLSNTKINFTIYYPDNSIFFHESKEPTHHDVNFGNFTVGNNMSVGNYKIIIEWTNNNTYLMRDKVGHDEINFIVWHHTNLTAINSYIERLVGDPLLIKVKFIDDDFNSSIEFATITYNSIFGQSGTMIYLGSGIYFAEIDTSSLELGDYYFSFNATKTFYQNQTINNLIHLKIIPQSLELKLSHSIIETSANNIISCQVNVTGAITKALLWPANISTDWFNPYNVTDHNNGTYTLDFSTSEIPTGGYLESYTISIFANKTDYGKGNAFLTLLVHPIPTIASVNISLISVYQNDIIKIRANYTDEGSKKLISGANCSVSWQASYVITPITNEFDITLNTSGLCVDYYVVLITFERAGYESAFKSVTVIVNEKEVNISVSINSIEIEENSLFEAYFRQQINISARVCTIIDGIYISGGTITLISDNYENNFTESSSTYFNISIILDESYFNPSINTIFLRFQQTNYSTMIFAFQLYIRAQPIDLIVQINDQNIPENFLLQLSYNQIFYLSCRAYAEIDAMFLSGATITFINNENEILIPELSDFWYNTSIIISNDIFSIGPNYIYIRFEQFNYTTTVFSFQVLVIKVDIEVNTIDFQDSIDAFLGDTIIIKINLTESGTGTYIENATIFYSWEFGLGYFDYVGNGTYELELKLSKTVGGNHKLTLVISKEGSIYNSKEFSFMISIRAREQPNYVIWYIISGSLIGISILGVLTLRSYVILPLKRKRESDILAKTQRYKDIMNIEALILSNRVSGIHIYSKSYYFLREYQNELLSGFTQAIIMMSSQIVGKEELEKVSIKPKYPKGVEKIIELDFKHFNFIICDYKDIRLIFILKEKASERFKDQAAKLLMEIELNFSDQFENWDGDLRKFNDLIPPLLDQNFQLYYRDPFKLNKTKNIDQLKKEGDLSKMELRLLNVIISMTSEKEEFYLEDAIRNVYEKNQDKIIEALEILIERQILIPSIERNI